ncbi:hypothetical protein [Azospirillum argentinense]
MTNEKGLAKGGSLPDDPGIGWGAVRDALARLRSHPSNLSG